MRENAFQALEIVKTVIEESIEPSDKLMMAWMERETIEDAIFFNATVQDVKPVISPTIPATYTSIAPTNTPNVTPQGGLQALAETTQAGVEAVFIHATETQRANEYACQLFERSEHCENLITNWSDERNNGIQDLLNEYDLAIGRINPDDFIETTRIFNAISLASNEINEQCDLNKYARCILLIFADMNEWREEPPEDLEINLKGIDTAVILQDCIYRSQPSCSDRIREWTNHFNEFNSNPVSFIINENIVDRLKEYLEEVLIWNF